MSAAVCATGGHLQCAKAWHQGIEAVTAEPCKVRHARRDHGENTLSACEGQRGKSCARREDKHTDDCQNGVATGLRHIRRLRRGHHGSGLKSTQEQSSERPAEGHRGSVKLRKSLIGN